MSSSSGVRPTKRGANPASNTVATGTRKARRRAASSKVDRASLVSPSVSQSRPTVWRCGTWLTPRSMSPMVRALTPARSASSSWVKCAARRCWRSSSPKDVDTSATVSADPTWPGGPAARRVPGTARICFWADLNEKDDLETRMPTTIDIAAERDALVDRLMRATAGMFDIYTTYLGDRLGLYRALEGGQSSTSAEVAQRS